jgi:hypothetical protein
VDPPIGKRPADDTKTEVQKARQAEDERYRSSRCAELAVQRLHKGAERISAAEADEGDGKRGPDDKPAVEDAGRGHRPHVKPSGCRRCQSVALRKAFPAPTSRSSRRWPATSWKPIGMPASVKPPGSVIVGLPVMSKAQV